MNRPTTIQLQQGMILAIVILSIPTYSLAAAKQKAYSAEPKAAVAKTDTEAVSLEDRVVGRKKKASTLAEEASSGQMDVIATVDAPMQSNILSWQSSDKKAPKNDLEFSALRDGLMPTDRDRLSDEVRYSQILNQPEK